MSRPQLHFTAESGWINDPLGLTYSDGRYHLFFQYVPGSTAWAAGCHWGHATSSDLVSWREHPPALAPGEGDDGVWSGSIAVRDGSAALFYTSVAGSDLGMGRVRVATPIDASWDVWRKGPIVAEAPADLGAVAFRDPFVFRDGDGWRMLVGVALPGRAAAAAFRSPDLATWRYDGLAAERSSLDRDPVWTGALWECPQLFSIDGRHVLLVSVWADEVLHHVAYGVGSYADGRFTARSWGRLTQGSSYYAPCFFRDRDGSPSLIFWMRGVQDVASGRTGALSVPHRVRLAGDRLVIEPHPDLLAYGAPLAAAPQLRVPEPGAYLIRWDAAEARRLRIARAGRVVAELYDVPDALEIRTEDEPVTLAGGAGPVTLVVDGPCLEICTNAGAVAVGSAVGEPGDLEISGTDYRIWRLSRS